MRILRLVLIGLCALMPLGAIAAPANAALPPGISCATFQPFLVTAYGPVKICEQVASYPYGWQARMGYYSGVTNQFDPFTGWMEETCACQVSNYQVVGEDGYRSVADLSIKVNTAYGEARWGVQYRESTYPHKQGRFGVYNLLTDLFYPSSGWLKVIDE